MFSRFIHVVAYIRISFLFKTELYVCHNSIIQLYFNLKKEGKRRKTLLSAVLFIWGYFPSPTPFPVSAPYSSLHYCSAKRYWEQRWFWQAFLARWGCTRGWPVCNGCHLKQGRLDLKIEGKSTALKCLDQKLLSGELDSSIGRKTQSHLLPKAWPLCWPSVIVVLIKFHCQFHCLCVADRYKT